MFPLCRQPSSRACRRCRPRPPRPPALALLGGPARVDLQKPPEPTFPGPVAVLIGANTRNAGEDVTVAFEGRARTLFFGAGTAGFTILGVRVHRLSGGTTLGILETRDADRAGRVHRLPVEPETELPPDAALDTLPQDAIDSVLDKRAKASSGRQRSPGPCAGRRAPCRGDIAGFRDLVPEASNGRAEPIGRI